MWAPWGPAAASDGPWLPPSRAGSGSSTGAQSSCTGNLSPKGTYARPLCGLEKVQHHSHCGLCHTCLGILSGCAQWVLLSWAALVHMPDLDAFPAAGTLRLCCPAEAPTISACLSECIQDAPRCFSWSFSPALLHWLPFWMTFISRPRRPSVLPLCSPCSYPCLCPSSQRAPSHQCFQTPECVL